VLEARAQHKLGTIVFDFRKKTRNFDPRVGLPVAVDSNDDVGVKPHGFLEPSKHGGPKPLAAYVFAEAVYAELNGRAMGPEGSIAKLLWSEAEQHIAETAWAVLGPDALESTWARDRVYSRALTIAGGTTQVNKNIVARRILGLPSS
jgi:hypothetical protein